jgi:uncharacterized protein (DUF342 family)
MKDNNFDKIEQLLDKAGLLTDDEKWEIKSRKSKQKQTQPKTITSAPLVSEKARKRDEKNQEQEDSAKRAESASRMAFTATDLDIQYGDKYLDARISLKNPGQSVLEFDFLKDLFQRRGLIYGINWARVKHLVTNYNQGKTVENELIATGEPPVEGFDATINVYFQKSVFLKRYEGDFSRSSSRKIDHKNKSYVNVVKKGQLLAEKIPMKQGRDGKNVRGKVVGANPVKDVPLTAGLNTVKDEAGCIYSLIDGRPIFKEPGNISVSPTFFVQGNVDLSVGSINFKGDVEVAGNVQSGFTIQATGNVHVSGSVEGATVIAGDDITVLGGFFGAGKGILKCGGDCKVNHCNGGRLEVGCNLIVEKELVNCTSIVGNKLLAIEDEASIIGGHTHVSKEIYVKNLGSGLGVTTFVYMGGKKLLQAEIEEVGVELKELEYQLGLLKKAIRRVQRNHGERDLEESQVDQITKELYKAQSEIVEKKVQATGVKNELNRKLHEFIPSKICVGKNLHPGVRIYMGNTSFNNIKLQRSIEYYQDPESLKIRSRAYVPKRAYGKNRFSV